MQAVFPRAPYPLKNVAWGCLLAMVQAANA